VYLYDGNGIIQLTDDNYDSSSFTPSGKNIYWQGYDGNDYEIFVYDIDKNSIRQNYHNFIEEGIAFYVYPGDAGKGIDFYRFQNTLVPGTYLFVGEEERQNILANFPQFVEEGVAFEAFI
jgi:hypothetical protein